MYILSLARVNLSDYWKPFKMKLMNGILNNINIECEYTQEGGVDLMSVERTFWDSSVRSH